MQSVSKEKFYAKIGPLNVVGSIQPTPYPYTCIFRMQTGAQEVVGKTVDRQDGGCVVTDYFLAAPSAA